MTLPLTSTESEPKLPAPLSECYAHGVRLFLRSSSGDPGQYLVHIQHGRIIAFLNQLVYLVKLQQGVIIYAGNQHSLIFRKIIVRIHSHDSFKLLVQILLISPYTFSPHAFRPYYQVRIELVPHYFPREVIVETAVKKQYGVDDYRLEVCRESHRSPYSRTQIPFVRHVRLLAQHIGRYTEKRYHEVVKIIAGRSRSIGKYLDKRYTMG